MSDNNHELFDDEDLNIAVDRMAELDPDDAALKNAWPKFLIELVDVMAAELERMGDPEPRRKAQHLIAHQAHHLGGKMIYLPRDDRLRTAMRDMEIYSEYTGGNSRALSEKYGLTQQRICNIVKVQHSLHRKRIQRDLF